ncbi:hypothetical protein MPER_09038, partial [Moniliophthora perniciosa FA553]
PLQPVLNGQTFLSTVKALPEEWYQSSSVLKPQSAFQNVVRPVDVHFFVPVVRVFGIRDTIPVHIRFCGPLSSLRVAHSHLVLEDESVKRSDRCKNWVIGSGILPMKKWIGKVKYGAKQMFG